MLADMRALISGAAHTEIGHLDGASAWSLQVDACRAAVEDAGLEPADIDGLLAEPGYTQPVIDGITPHYLRLGAMLGMSPSLCGAEVLGGASSVAMVQRAAAAIEGRSDVRIVCAPTAMRRTQRPARSSTAAETTRPTPVRGGRAPRDGRPACTWKPTYDGGAARCRRRRREPSRSSDTARAVPRSPRPRRLSRCAYVVDPLRKRDCCPVSDCGAAVVVSAADRLPAGGARRREDRRHGPGPLPRTDARRPPSATSSGGAPREPWRSQWPA